MTRGDLIESRISKPTADFGHYVKVYDQQISFTGEQLAAHRDTTALRRHLGSASAAANDRDFTASLWQTLRAWRLGMRASRLVPEGEFAAVLQAVAPRLVALKPLTIDGPDLPNDIADQLWLLIQSFGVVDNKAKLVADTKALHHLLLDLVIPMDHIWTGAFSIA